MEDKTILSLGQRTVTHSPRFLVTLESAKSKNQSEWRDEEEATSRLHIRQLREADRGCYMCQLNTKPMLSQLGCVDVLGMPNCALYRIPTARYSRVFAVARVHTRHVRTHRFRLAYLREGMENMRASPLEYVSMGPLYHHASPVLLARLASIRFHHPPIPTSLRLPPSPLCTGYNATQPYITRRPSLSFSLRVCSLPLDRRSCVACVCVDTARGGENENSSRVRMLASGIQLERAIGPNGMKFLCGQTQERSRASFFSLAQPELPPICTIFVQPESRVIEMASLFLRAYPERNEISLGECSFCSTLFHLPRRKDRRYFIFLGSREQQF